MAYEFVNEEPTGRVPTVPIFWNLRVKHIYQLMVSEPVFVTGAAIIEDPETGELGIDTNDPVPNPNKLPFGGDPEPIGLMRYMSGNATPQDGFVADLRYATRLPDRDLGLEDYDNPFKTKPLLGAIFLDPSDHSLSLRSQYRHDQEFQSFAKSLMMFVDAERSRRGVFVFGSTAENQSHEKAAATNVEVQFSSRQQSVDEAERSGTIDSE